MTTQEVSPAVRDMARKAAAAEFGSSAHSGRISSPDWIEIGYLRARADVEAEIEKEIQSHNVFSARMILQALLGRLRNPPAPLHPAVMRAAENLRRASERLCESEQFGGEILRRDADALEAAARENGWVSK